MTNEIANTMGQQKELPEITVRSNLLNITNVEPTERAFIQMLGDYNDHKTRNHMSPFRAWHTPWGFRIENSRGNHQTIRQAPIHRLAVGVPAVAA